MINTVFLLGNHIQSLGLARQLRNYNIDVILFTDSKYSICRFSNTIKKTYFFKNEIDLLIKIKQNKSNLHNTLIFPTNDHMVGFLCVNYDELLKDFFIGIPHPDIVNIFADKRNTYRFAAEHNIPFPESHYPLSINDVEELSGKVNYPVIIKPAIMHVFYKTFSKKAFKCDSPSELIKEVKKIEKKFPVDQLIIQEFLDGGAKDLYSYATFSVNGKSIAALIANRPRQNPMNFGNSTTYAITSYIPEIKIQAEKILELTNYFGLAEVEFMYDKKSKQYKFLEINTRAWKWHSISEGLGFSFIGKMISYYNENDLSELKNFDKVTAWVERLTDIAVVIKELFKGNNILKETISSYKVSKVYAVWSSKDPLPFLCYIFLSPILYFKRH
jgi:predicted ATP-grasp superfamily ATP-dependent carboligase